MHANSKIYRRLNGLSPHWLFLFLWLLFSLPALYVFAGEKSGESPLIEPGSAWMLQGGNLHLESGEVIKGGMLLIENGLISDIGQQLEVPEGLPVLDVSGMEVYPGLILSRSSLGLSEIGRVRETSDMNELGSINPNVRAQVAFHPASEHIGVAAVHGVTTVVSTPSGGLISGLPAAMATHGWTWEQMLVQAPLGLQLNWPDTGREKEYEAGVKEINEAFAQARRYMQARQAMQSGIAQTHPVDMRWEAMIPVLNNELPVLVSARSVVQIQAALAWAEKQKVRIIISGGQDACYVAPQLAGAGVPVLISPVIGGPARDWEAYDVSYTLPVCLYRAGVEFAIAGEASAAGAYRLAHHAASAVAFGLPAHEALKAITIYPARILGLDSKLGSLEKGKQATFVVTKGDLLELWIRPEMVVIGGETIQMQDKHLRLYEQYRKR